MFQGSFSRVVKPTKFCNNKVSSALLTNSREDYEFNAK